MSTLYRKVLLPVIAASFVIASTAMLTSCDEGPAEKTGKKVDEQINDTKRAIQDAVD